MFRRVMIGAAAGLGLASPALAQNRPAAAPQRRPPARPAGPPATPAQSPIGPVDTIARSVLLVDFETGATLLNKRRMTACRHRPCPS
jgi:serine-type D-Ala-D-Ala carboxypeptidase (penicillin-binding protein 5/6)